nr:tetratricopeptide repeat protein [bacterium]
HSLDIRITLADARRVKSRKTELLLHIEMLEEALRMYTEVFSRGRWELLNEIVHLLLTLAETHLAADNSTGALHAYTRAAEAVQPVIRKVQALEMQCLLADVYNRKAAVLADCGRFEEAVSLHDDAVRLCEEVLKIRADTPAAVRLVSTYLSRSRTAGKAGDYDGAVENARKAQGVCQTYAAVLRPDTLEALRAAGYGAEANALQATGYFKTALEAYENAETAMEKIRSRDTTRSQYNLAVLSMNRARVLIQIAQSSRALEHLDRAVALIEEQIRKFGRKEHRRELAIALQHRAAALRMLGRCDEALSAAEASIAIREAFYRRAGIVEMAYDLALSYLEKGRILSMMDAWTDAADWLGRAAHLLEEAIQQSKTPMALRHQAHALGDLAVAQLRLGAPETALENVDRALASMDDLVDRAHHSEFAGDRALLQMVRGQVLDVLGRSDDAAAIRKQAAVVLKSEAERTGRADF